ncbi:MAG TPA: hypothetical protein VJ866_23355 [Pyrinomonadaceae bacterium]|nr:hypothetical protein [Pyrinomonadaceae bacterium]
MVTLLADAEALLVAEDDAGVYPACGRVLAVQVHEVADIKGVEDASLFCRVGEVLLVRSADQSRLKRCLDVSPAQAECLHEVVVHRVLVDVEAGLH